MGKEYIWGSPESSKPSEQDLKQRIKEEAMHAALNRTYTINCPHCEAQITVRPGKSPCPRCGETVDLVLKLKD